MRRTICCAILALLVTSGAVFAQRHVAPHPWSRVRVIYVHRWCPPLLVQSPILVPYQNPGPYAASYPVGDYTPPSLNYVFVGSSSPAHPQLVFKDGTIYNVSDYWRVGDQLHFITVEEGGTKSVPHSVLFDTLDEQRTKDAAAAQGFKFLIRDKPIQEWLEHQGSEKNTRLQSQLGKQEHRNKSEKANP